MQISAALAADLAVLTEALGDPDVDIGQTLLGLADAAAAAVASYVGLAIRLEAHGRVLTLAAFEGSFADSDVHSSLRTGFPDGLPKINTALRPRVFVVLYASTPGAFVDLAADLTWLTKDTSTVDAIELDADISSHEPTELATSMQDFTLVNQAVGVLIGRGRSQAEAERELHLRAVRHGGEWSVAAAAVLAQLERTGPDPPPLV